MKRKYVKLVFSLFLLFYTNWVSAQFYDAALSKYEDQFPKEKMHVHCDKTIYNLSETIFYKIYVLEGNDLTTLSKNVYVSWYDTSGNYINQTVAPLIQSSAKGSFDVPANYKGNFIHMKAFTRWMLNDDSTFIYEKYLPINNGSISNTKEIKPHTIVDIFPEGGVLVNGLKTKLAFKATNGFGIPVYLKGVLQNSKNEILDSIKVAHDGMGIFYVTPNEGEQYHIHWIDEFLQEGITTVMPAQKEGVSLNVSMGYQKAYVQVERTKLVPDNYKQLKLLVHQNQHLLYSVDFKSGEPLQQKIGLNIDTFPTGIVQFSLFTSDWLPIAERILFVNNHLPEFDAKINVTSKDLDKRGKNTIEVEVSDSIPANMSIAITDANLVLPEQQSIYSDFLLSSEIRGKVYNPAYYFSSDADIVADHLDLVMLTNGWRKFDWDKLRAGILPELKYPKETDYMKLSGRVSSKTKLPINLMLNLVIQAKDSSKQFLFVPVLKDGSFEDKTVIFYDTATILFSINEKNYLTLKSKIQFENGFLNHFPTKIFFNPVAYEQNYSEPTVIDKMNEYLNKQEKLRKLIESSTLKEVVVKSRIKTPKELLDKEYSSGLFSGETGMSFDLLADVSATGYTNIMSYLQGKVAGLQISVDFGKAKATWHGSITDVFVNETLTPMEAVLAMSVSDIAYVKTIRPPFIGSVGGGPGGAIAIYTKRGYGEREVANVRSKMETTTLAGYSVFKEFYNPNYEKTSENFLADNRTTLYWNPYILTNGKNKKVSFEFYNNDTSKKLQIVLEGVNANGKLTRVVKYLE